MFQFLGSTEIKLMTVSRYSFDLVPEDYFISNSENPWKVIFHLMKNQNTLTFAILKWHRFSLPYFLLKLFIKRSIIVADSDEGFQRSIITCKDTFTTHWKARNDNEYQIDEHSRKFSTKSSTRWRCPISQQSSAVNRQIFFYAICFTEFPTTCEVSTCLFYSINLVIKLIWKTKITSYRNVIVLTFNTK